MKEPETETEWQQAIDVAAAARAVADCKMYGLLTGGPEINVARCDDILERGKARGVMPSKPAEDLAIALVRDINDAQPEPLTRTPAAQT